VREGEGKEDRLGYNKTEFRALVMAQYASVVIIILNFKTIIDNHIRKTNSRGVHSKNTQKFQK